MVKARQELRDQKKLERASLSLGKVEAFSRQISDKLNVLHPIRKAKSIMCFSHINNEVDLHPFMQEQSKLGKTVLLPRLENKTDLAGVEFQNWQSTCHGAFGILEPLGLSYLPADIDAIIVPGLVFDKNGHRLGYGRGYYDRFLKQLSSRTFVCGVCYDFQVVDSVFPHSGDVPMKYIVTEKSEVVIDYHFF